MTTFACTPIDFNLQNGAWYVASTGNDANSCLSPDFPCATINGAINKASAGDAVVVAEGMYMGAGLEEVVLINKSLTLAGGWDNTFTIQNGASIIDGQEVRRGITVNYAVSVLFDHFTIQNGNHFLGGGILNDGSMIINNTTISHNNAGVSGSGPDGGGGIQNNGTLALTNSTVNSNTVLGGFDGGGILNNGTAQLNNSTVSGNTGGQGAVFNNNDLILNNSTISRNQTYGIHNYGTVTVQNTILAENGTNGDCFNSPYYNGTITSQGYNIIRNNSGCMFTPTTGDLVGTNASPINPQLAPLQDNGGSTLTMALLPGSPAINTGDDASCPETDQRGVTRPQGSHCDIGAYESNITHFAVIGDYGLAGQPELDVANRVKRWGPDFVITLGDNNYELGSAATIDQNIGQYYHEFISPYTGLYGAGAVTNQFFPSLGNHDWATPGAQPYLNYFTLPGNERYYDYVQGPVHFFVIDSDPHEPDGISSSSIQAVWLQNELAASTSPWNIVYMHHPPYSSGEHGSNPIMQWPFAAWGVDAVLAGHDHTYERLFRDGIPYFVNGLGGKSLYRFRSRVFGSQLRYGADYGAMLVDATESQMIFKFITRTGNEIDSFALPNTLPQVDTYIAGNLVGLNLIGASQGARDSYTGVNAGPVKVVSANAVPIIAAERYAWLLNGVVQSFSEMMGLPASQVTDTYYFPWYNNVTMDTQLRFANPGAVPTDITVTIAGVAQLPITVAAGQSTRVSYAGINNGPVKVESSGGVPIIVAERDAWLLNGVVQSFSEMMGLPGNQLTDTYYFPWYNNVTMDTQLRFANLGLVPTDITVTIAGVAQPPITLAAGQSARVSYPGINAGPVQVQSTGGTPIIVAERDAWLINGVVRSFSEMMGLPANQLTETYYFPWYNNVTMDTQLRFANLGNTSTDITVTIAGVPQPPVTVAAGQSTRISYPGINNGPVKVESSGGVPIIVAERDAWLLNGIVRSFSEMMGLPGNQLTTTYYFPWYNNITMDTQLRFAVP